MLITIHRLLYIKATKIVKAEKYTDRQMTLQAYIEQ